MISFNKSYTANGKPVRIISLNGRPASPVIGIIDNPEPCLLEWRMDGTYYSCSSKWDLVQAMEIKWYNVYFKNPKNECFLGRPWTTEEEAKSHIIPGNDEFYVQTIKIEYEKPSGTP